MNQNTQVTVFDEAFAQYGDAIFRFCIVKVSNVELAEDLTQEVFMRYWGYLKEDKEIQNPRALLYTIANNLAKDWYKKKKSDSLDDQIALGYDPVEKSAGPQLLAEQAEVIDALAQLEENDREIMVLRYVDGLDPKDIALILNESANVISVRINRATKRLQTILHI
ncbi:RNA polymerase sigma factor [Patescibacteria group bacterium]|nr:RNA polymerase sigma factor [Patescibacteria group bacterium]